MPRWARAILLCLPVIAAFTVGPVRASQAHQTSVEQPPDEAAIRAGEELWRRDCGVCHGAKAGGGLVAGNPVPSLQGVGAAGVDFAVSTGRMPLANPSEQARRGSVTYQQAEIDALVAYAETIVDGPPVPEVDLSDVDVAEGGRAYRENCASCHQMAGQGGILTSGRNVPPLGAATSLEIVEAIRSGPNDMPPFTEEIVDEQDAANIAAYLQDIDDPADRGGWPLGHWGPVPEGAAAFAFGLIPLVVIARLLGDRNQPSAQEDEIR